MRFFLAPYCDFFSLIVICVVFVVGILLLRPADVLLLLDLSSDHISLPVNKV